MKDAMRIEFNRILESCGFSLNEKGKVVSLVDDPFNDLLCLDIQVVEKRKTFSEEMPDTCFLICFEIVSRVKDIGRALTAGELMVWKDQIARLAKLMNVLENKPVTFIIDKDGNVISLRCSNCVWWKDRNHDYGTCTCRYSSAHDCRTISFHVCSLIFDDSRCSSCIWKESS